MMVERSCREEPPLGYQSPCSEEPPPETPQGMPEDLGQPKGDRHMTCGVACGFVYVRLPRCWGKAINIYAFQGYVSECGLHVCSRWGGTVSKKSRFCSKPSRSAIPDFFRSDQIRIRK